MSANLRAILDHAYRIRTANPQMSMSECIAMARSFTPSASSFVKLRIR
jgi:hypothetical protein